ncbi:Pc06g00320 [Penicillium rubens Wisconsin 54-1255]|uniref:Pc06g00320 protein n=1 Tax=Penicillium rubens (strain ATCC 28089 / DSM 1075 / NRRL 1951 / Wisconsin 54-1255) TaxID=500485 RepID=B6GVX7_PENRW|nr:Pc06g00320 [Penicillium rubens Wisconsin 54-1255]
MASKTLLFLTAEQIQRLHLRYINKPLPIQLNMLESAIHSPIDMEHYTKEEDVFQLAANLAEKIMRNHAFQDGNKRTALVAADMFLKINGYYLQKVPFAEDKNDKELSNAHVAVVTNQWTAKQLGDYYKSIAVPLGPATTEVTEYIS